MDGSGTGIGRLDCYEDMFKEITRKLYGEDPDHRITSSVQNEFEAPIKFETVYKTEMDEGDEEEEEEEEDDDEEDMCHEAEDAIEHDDIDQVEDIANCDVLEGQEEGQQQEEEEEGGSSWILDDEPLKGTDGSRVAAYRAATSTWRCYECGDLLNGDTRVMAEHYVDQHSSRTLSADEVSRSLRLCPGRSRDPFSLISSNVRVEDVIAYLERIRGRTTDDGRHSQPNRRTQETQTLPAANANFLLHEVPASPPQLQLQSNILAAAVASLPSAPQLLAQPAASISPASVVENNNNSSSSSSSSSNNNSTTTMSSNNRHCGNNAIGKRYTCLHCPYGTDRRDLFTRHENIHRDEKPFYCYVCNKSFSRADHVKKHFLRMHREHTYEMSRIRRPVSQSPAKSAQQPVKQESASEASFNSPATTTTSFPVKAKLDLDMIDLEHMQRRHSSKVRALYEAAGIVRVAKNNNNNNNNNNSSVNIQPDLAAAILATAAATNSPPAMQQVARARFPAVNNNNSSSSSNKAKSSVSKANPERRYTCYYCSWSGADNWCLKRHLNTHLKPYACALCDYKAARAERLSTHVLKVHNRRQCSRCTFLADDLASLQVHQLQVHRVTTPSVAAAVAAAAATASDASSSDADVNMQGLSQLQTLTSSGGANVGTTGPLVFSSPATASSATTATMDTAATTVVPTTTAVLGNATVVPATSCEERRSRKQRVPRRILACPSSVNDEDNNDDVTSKTTTTTTQEDEEESSRGSSEQESKVTTKTKLRCFLCRRSAPARGLRYRPYHSRQSLLLHKLWRHSKPRKRDSSIEKKVVPITLRATVYATRA